MKKILYFAVMALFMAGMTACEDEPVNNGGNGGNGSGPLVGTEWALEETETEVEEGVTITDTFIETLSFTTSTSGKLSIDMVETANGVQVYSYSDFVEFTYAFSGTVSQGQGTITSVDEETGETENWQFTVSGNQLTVMTYDDETGEPDPVVYTRK